MFEEINDVNIFYKLYGNKKGKTILLLHGWGQNIEMMHMLGDPFVQKYNILIIDLPGFGKSSEPPFAFTLDDYVECIKELLDRLCINETIVIGHSFGGKIALMYASKYNVSKLVLLASPINHNTNLSLKVKVLKSLKKIPVLSNIGNSMKRHIGSTDYKNASDIMRQVMVNHVNYDAYPLLKNIKCPTLLIWGTNDQAVSINVAYEIKDQIKDCGIVVYDNCTHYAYLERLDQTISVLNSFIGGSK